MRLHYIQHVPFEGPANILEWAKDRGLSVSCTKVFKKDPFPSLASFDFLVVMGGPMGVGEKQKYPWIEEEKGFIKEAMTAGKTVLGVCLGAQLMAEAIGGVVRKGRFKEIGWFPVSLTPPAWDHPVFSVLPPTFHAFHWHGDTFSIPEGAMHMASSEGCPNQAFFYGKNAIGLQFHIETNEQSLREILKGSKEDLDEEGPYCQAEEEILAFSRERLRPLKEYLYRFLDAVKENSP